ncbi:MAG: hypothetical protein ACI92Z_000999 [Paracoccaceae bacterium]|jgi:hypothetical protein
MSPIARAKVDFPDPGWPMIMTRCMVHSFHGAYNAAATLRSSNFWILPVEVFGSS